MNKELTKSKLIKEYTEYFNFYKEKSTQSHPMANEINNTIASLYGKFIQDLEQLSDKPQISEEDFEKLDNELFQFCVTNRPYYIGIKDILEKYLKTQPPKEPCICQREKLFYSIGKPHDIEQNDLNECFCCPVCGEKLSEVQN